MKVEVEKNTQRSCAALIDSQYAIEVKANRSYLTHIIRIIHFLAKQGLAFRGHDENKEKENSKNMGNFLELLDFHSEILPDLHRNAKSKIAKYTSATIQNEVIHLIAKQLKNGLLPSSYYAVICDETMDLSRKEMLALCLRKVDDTLRVHEKFFGFHRLVFHRLALVLELNLDLQQMVGQSYDGAATMSGKKTGVAKRFIDQVPYAVFIHCYAHKLNLALQDATAKLKSVSDVLLIIQNVSVFVERSAKRHALFEHIQCAEKKRTLQNFCSTRWASRYLALNAFVKMYKYLLTFLEVCQLLY